MMKVTQWKKVMIILLIAVMSAALIACGSANQNQQGSGAAPSPSPSASPEAEQVQEQEKPEAEAKQLSGKVVVYSAGPKGLAEDIQQAFENKTGVTVEMFQGTTGAILGRLEAEAANPVADVIVLASWPAAADFKKQGLTQAYPGAKHADQLFWVDGEMHYFGYSASALGVTYNTLLIDSPPKDWDDFLKPEYKDLVNIPDPLLSGSALDFIAAYMNVYGDSGWDLFTGLKANGATAIGANQPALDPVITGAKGVVLAGVDYMAYSAKAKGEPVDMFYPESGTVINPRPAFILSTSPNLDNAQAFIDFLLEEEAQKLVSKAYLLPGREDIPAEGRAGVDEIPLLTYDWDWMAENQDKIRDQFVNIFNK